MKKLPKKYIIGGGIISLALVFLLASYLNNFIKRSIFLSKYDVLTVGGGDWYDYEKIDLNNKTIEKTDDSWTDILGIPGTSQYLKLKSSFSKERDIMCGGSVIGKKIEQFLDGENDWCIDTGKDEFIAITSPTYYPYNEDFIVHERCLDLEYYDREDSAGGHNGCAERGLFLNNQKIAISPSILDPKTGRLYESASFNYSPSRQIENLIIYTLGNTKPYSQYALIPSNKTYFYDILSGETELLYSSDGSNPTLKDIFIIGGNTVLVTEQSRITSGGSLGQLTFEGRRYGDIKSANYIGEDFYFLKFNREIEHENNKNHIYELFKNGNKVSNIEIEAPIWSSYDQYDIKQFPECGHDTIVCVYEDGHYAYRSKILESEFFNFSYQDGLFIDGETLDHNIPGMFRYPKPIFEEGKLKYLVYTSILRKGLYVVDFDKKWDYKKIYLHRGQAITKIKSGYQTKILSIIKK